MGRYLGTRDLEAALKGGSVFACGGGGFLDHGRMLGTAAINAGRPELVGIDEIADDAFIATAAAIGAPGGFSNWEMRGGDYLRAVELLQAELGQKLAGLIIGQNGKSSTVNAWLPSAVLGTKVVDAVGDIRAHPTADMGSIGLEDLPDVMIQTAAGGNRAENRYIELVVKGQTGRISPILRATGGMAGGFIASCRNPIRASYVRAHAALGGISLALSLGEAILKAEEAHRPVIDAVTGHLDGEIVGRGVIKENTVAYSAAQAWDIGIVTIGEGSLLRRIHVMNEHMAVETAAGERLSTFPDVITTFAMDGTPLSSNELTVGLEIAVMKVSRTKIPLASNILNPELYRVPERMLGIDLIRYLAA